MPGTFEVSSRSTDVAGFKVYVLSLTGSVDASAAGRLDRVFTGAIEDGGQHFVLDCAGMEYISSAGLRLLLKLRKAALDAGGRVKVAALPREIRETVFDSLGFSRLMDLYVGVDEALESIGPTVR